MACVRLEVDPVMTPLFRTALVARGHELAADSVSPDFVVIELEEAIRLGWLDTPTDRLPGPLLIGIALLQEG